MSDIKNIFDKVREEARQQAERSLYDLESRFPALPIGGDSMFQSARPKYTDEQRQAYIANEQQEAVNRLGRFLVDVSLGKNVTQVYNPAIADNKTAELAAKTKPSPTYDRYTGVVKWTLDLTEE